MKQAWVFSKANSVKMQLNGLFILFEAALYNLPLLPDTYLIPFA